jgi:hypothetical protein
MAERTLDLKQFPPAQKIVAARWKLDLCIRPCRQRRRAQRND